MTAEQIKEAAYGSNRKLCTAGHSAIQFWCARCPVCENIERLDRELLKADCEAHCLERKIAELERQNNKLINAQVSNLKENYNGGPC